MKFAKALLILSIVGIVLALSGCTSLTSNQPTPQPTLTMVYTDDTTDTPTPTPTPTIAATRVYTPTPTQIPNEVNDYYNVSIGLSISNDGNISISNNGGPGTVNLLSIKIIFGDRTGATHGPDTASNLASYGVSGDLSPESGSSATINAANCGYMTHVIVQGNFRDGMIKTLAEDWLTSGYG